MIVRVKFVDGAVMMFGTSYKKWTIQFDEYCWDYKNQLSDIENIEVSNSNWIGWGGLKWCPEDRFQHQLNREGCQPSEPDKPKPRRYSEMSFYHDTLFEKIARRILKDCRNDVSDPLLIYSGKLPKEA